ncbi:MAG: FAD-binding oxidoreductase [Sandaracinaceae bacterium]|nr:FAD-binding oxidoreductase [Sandaracinaceae bacterium]
MRTAPDPTVLEAFLSRATAIVGASHVTTNADDLATYGRDWTKVHTPAPSAVVLPRTSEEVAALVRTAHELAVPVVPSGGRTGLAAGAVAAFGEVVLSLDRMRSIGAVDPRALTVEVEAGAVTAAVHAACEPHGLTWPVDFASKGSSTVGGNIATNAGGVKVIRYGLTRQWVLGLEVVTGTGELLRLNGALEKNNTGIDLRQLFIGSEGVLGIVTRATLKLTRLPKRLDVMLLAVSDLAGVLRLFERARSGPFVLSAFEVFTERCYARVQRHRGLSLPIATRTSHYVLVEVETSDAAALEAWLESLLVEDVVLDGTLAENVARAQAIWELREGISESLSATGLPHKNDIALPIAELEGFVAELEGLFAREWPGFEICLFGHIGDGNLHVNVMKPDAMSKEEFLGHAHAADEQMFALVRAHRGSISAEHGIGLLKKDFLGYTRTAEEIAIFRAIKAVLDPRGILNPGKVF